MKTGQPKKVVPLLRDAYNFIYQKIYREELEKQEKKEAEKL
jgi:hypothetical protein